MKAGRGIFVAGLASLVVFGCTIRIVDDEPKEASPQERLEGETGTKWIIELDERTGTPRIATAVDPIPTSGEVAYEVAARAFLTKYKDLFQIEDPDAQLAFVDTVTVRGLTVARFQQRAAGVPIDGKNVSVWFRADRSIGSISGSTHPRAGEAVVSPAIDAEAARAAVLADLATRYPGFDPAWIKQPEAPTQVLIPDGPGAKLAWAMQVAFTSPTQSTELRYRVDAQSGAILSGFEDQPSLRGSGIDVLGQTREFEVTEADNPPGMYALAQSGTDARTQIVAASVDPPAVPIVSSSLTSWDPRTEAQGGVGAAVSAYANLTEIDAYFRSRFNWRSFDDRGSPFNVIVHDAQTPLAKWNRRDSSFHFYDGGGDVKPLAGARDLCAHEYMHAVLEHLIPGGLEYYGESGAVSESLADIFGTFAELAISEGASRLLGSDVAPTGIRDLANPTNPEVLANSSVAPELVNRDSYKEIYRGAEDNGGVHVNSGILANAWHLMTFGGKHTFTGVEVYSPIGVSKSEDLWWLTASAFIPGVDIKVAAEAVTHAALLMHQKKSPELTAVACAFAAVEIFSVADVESSYEIKCAKPEEEEEEEEEENECRCVNQVEDIALCKTSPGKNQPCNEFSGFEGKDGGSCTGYRSVEETEMRCDCMNSEGIGLCEGQYDISTQSCSDSDYDGLEGAPCGGSYLDLDLETNQVIMKGGQGTLQNCSEVGIKQTWIPAGGTLDCSDKWETR